MLKLIITPRFCDIDGLGHVNNTRISEWFDEAILPIYRVFNPELDFDKWNIILARVEIDYVKQLRLNTPVEIRSVISKIGNTSFTVQNEVWQNNELRTKGAIVAVHFDFKNQQPVPIPDDIRNILKIHLDEKEQCTI